MRTCIREEAIEIAASMLLGLELSEA